MKTLRLILGDQLNRNHSWYKIVDASITYVFMEVRTETDYVWHHVQKVVGFFAAMQQFAAELKQLGHEVVYFELNDENNHQSFEKNIDTLIKLNAFTQFDYQLPDEYRLDQLLKRYTITLSINHSVFDTEHFFSEREELGLFFKGKKT